MVASKQNHCASQILTPMQLKATKEIHENMDAEYEEKRPGKEWTLVEIPK